MNSSLTPNDSRAFAFVQNLRPLGLDGARRMVRAMWAKLSVQERAALTAQWLFWARSKQIPPATAWKTWGFLTGRGFGKTWAVSHFVNDEVEAGRAPLICLVAQDEQSAIDLQVNGPNGLITTAPPWFKPRFEASALQVVWPNGSRAYVRSPESPGKIRGLEYYLTWMCELQSWPKATMREAFDNVFISTRLGYGRVVWDATAKRRHPLLKELLAQNEADPETDVIVRGSMYENGANLGDGYVDTIERKYGGTQRGREEIQGEMLEDVEGALFKATWIRRRPMPEPIARRVISIDPAVTDRKGSDTTGIVEMAVDGAGAGYVIGDYSGKYKPEAWGAKALDRYVEGRCDLVLAETNKGGQLVAQNLRSIAQARGLSVVVVGKEERPQHNSKVVYVKEVYARGAKEDRAEPVATAYERGRVFHVEGADLSSIEDTLTTWEPAPNADSPGDLDALVHACAELLDLSSSGPDPKAGFQGIAELGKALTPTPSVAVSHGLAAVFSSSSNAGRI